MRKFFLGLLVVAACFSGYTSKFVRDSDRLEAPDSSDVGPLKLKEGDNKGPTPKNLSIERVLNADGSLIPRSKWNPLAKNVWGELTRNPAPGHHGVANVTNHPPMEHGTKPE